LSCKCCTWLGLGLGLRANPNLTRSYRRSECVGTVCSVGRSVVMTD
jgi:hypothetical protein